jgi:phage tail sheath protein FI
VSVRRLFVFLEQSIDHGTQWAVFEPNHEVVGASAVAPR